MKFIKPDYTHSILNVTTSILSYYDAPTKYPTNQMIDEYLQKQPKHVLLLLLDGLGVNLLNKYLDEKDALRAHLKDTILSVFPATTASATTSVLSGLAPIEHGYLGWHQYFEAEQTHNVMFLNSDYYTEALNGEPALTQKYLPYQNIFSQIGEADPTIQLHHINPSFDPINGFETFEEQIAHYITLQKTLTKSFTYMYWVEPDMTQHISGVNSIETKEMVQSLNSNFEHLIQNLANDTLLITIADHGLLDVTEIMIEEYPDITNLLRAKPALETRTTAFYVKEGQQDLFKERFLYHFKDKFNLYSKEEFLKLGYIGSQNKHNMIDSFLGDFISISKSEYNFNFLDEPGHKGHHGGNSEEEMVVPLIIYKK